MPEDVLKRIDTLEAKIDAVYVSTEKTRKYILTMLVGSVALLVLPLFGLLFAIPSFLSTYDALSSMDSMDGMGGIDAMSTEDAELKALLEDLAR